MKMFEKASDDRAVSPVIGVILMVAITVILAAVIGFFVLDLGSGTESAPQASFTIEDTGSGPQLVVQSTSGALDGGTLSCSGGASGCGFSDGTTYSAGDPVSISSPTSGETLNIIWSSPNSDQSSTIASIDIP